MNNTIEFETATAAVAHLKALVDVYWNKTIAEEEFISELTIFFSYSKNRGHIMRGSELAPVMEKLGKKRLETFKAYLPKIDNGKYNIV